MAAKIFFITLFFSFGIDQLVKFFSTPFFSDWSFFIFSFHVVFQETFHEPFLFLHMPPFIVFILLIILVFIICYALNRLRNKYHISHGMFYFFAGLLCGGIISNSLDRLFYGAVKNIITIFSLGSFNFADTFIIISVCILILFVWKKVPYTKSNT